MTAEDIVLAAGARTTTGRYRGRWSQDPATRLGARAVAATLARANGLSPDYIALANVLQAGNGQNPARQAAVGGGVARTVPAITLNDVCLASLSSIRLAHALLRTGEIDTALVGGFESMTRAPVASAREAAAGAETPVIDVMVTDGLWCALDGLGMGEIAERENARLGITREEQDAFALESHERAAAATDRGAFTAELLDDAADEGIRRDSSAEKLAALRPAFSEDGTITAGNASQLSDAAAVGLVTTSRQARAYGVEPLATIIGSSVVAGPDASLHLKPAAAAHQVLAAHGLSVRDVALWEINEAFAGVVLAAASDLEIPLDRVNVNGGAIALGHPLGASGFRTLLTLVYELRRRGGGYGVATMCGGGGQGHAVLVKI